MERISGLIRPPRSVSIVGRRAGSVQGEWISPKRGTPDTAILYLHGGAFCSGSPATHRHLAGRISKQTGAVVFVPHYRLAPEHPFPAALEDCIESYHSLLDAGFSPDRIIIAGDSAGGNLTLVLLLYLRDNGMELPSAGVCLSPVTDLARGDEDTKRLDAERAPMDPMIRLHFVAPMIDKYVGKHDPTEPLLSPLFADLRGLPPLLIQAGGDELLLTDARRFAGEAQRAGVDVTLRVYDGMWHVWQIFSPVLPEANTAVAELAEFISHRAHRVNEVGHSSR